MSKAEDLEKLPPAERNRALFEQARDRMEYNGPEAFDLLDQLLRQGFRPGDCWKLKAQILTSAEIPDTAIGCYDSALAFEPKDAESLVKKGWLLERLDRKSEALECYDRAIELHPDHTGAVFQKAELMYWTGQKEAALQWLDYAADINSDFTQVWYQRAKALYAMERFDESLMALERALELNGTFPRAWVMKAMLLDRKGLHEEALAAGENAIESDEEFDPARILQKGMLERLGRVGEAMKVAKYISEPEDGEPRAPAGPFVRYGQGPAPRDSSSETTSWARGRAGLLMRAGRLEGALAIYARLFQEDQQDLQSCIGLGRCLFGLRRYSDADWYLAKALEAFPKDSAIMGLRAWCLAVRGETVVALDLFNKALDIDRTNQQLWRDGAQTLVMMKKPKVALLLLDKATENDPADLEAWLRKAAVLMELKKYDDALSACDRALKLNAREPFAWSLKAQALRALKRAPEADWCQNQSRQLSKG